jgi:hypothetical protein
VREGINKLVEMAKVENAIIDLGLEFHAVLPQWLGVLAQYPSSRPVHLLICAAFHTIEDLLLG